jgi:hypothetical protein
MKKTVVISVLIASVSLGISFWAYTHQESTNSPTNISSQFHTGNDASFNEDGGTNQDSALNQPRIMILQLCREDYFPAERRIELLMDMGYTYSGPLYNNGINCTNILFVRR